MSRLADLVAASHAAWMSPVVEFILGTSEPGPVAALTTTALAAAVGADVVDARFYEPGVGIIVGLDLDDGRTVVAKVHRNTYATCDQLANIASARRDLDPTGDRGRGAPRVSRRSRTCSRPAACCSDDA